MEFYYADHTGQPVGPISQQHLEALLENGTLNAQSLIAIVGETEWKTLGSLFQIDRLPVEVVPAQVAPAPIYQAPQPQYSSASSYPARSPQPRAASSAALAPSTVNVLTSTRPWAYITSIYWWISALAFLGGAVFMIFSALRLSRELSGAGMGLMIGAIVLGVFGVLFAIPAMQCWSFGSNLSMLRYQPGYLEAACERQAAFFRTMGIYIILMFSIAILFVLFAAMTGKQTSESSTSRPYSQQGNL